MNEAGGRSDYETSKGDTVTGRIFYYIGLGEMRCNKRSGQKWARR